MSLNRKIIVCTFFFFQVVYLSDSTGYLPITPLRARPSSIYSNDLENFRPDVWDRDYNRRFRQNNTRVQRKFSCNG